MRRSKSVRRLAGRLGVALMVATGLAACGGGGGGSSFPSAPSAPVAITAANAPAVANESVNTSIEQFSDESLIPVSVEISSAAPTPQVLTRILRRSIERRNAFLDPADSIVSGVVVAQGPCDVSGSFSVDITSVNETTTRVTLIFNNCSDFPGETINGRLEETLTFTTTISDSVNIDLTITITGQPSLRTVGEFTLVESFTPNHSLRITGPRLAYVFGSETIVLTNFDITTVIGAGFFETSGSFTLASTTLNGSVTVSIDPTTPLVRNVSDAHPNSGQIVVTGANNSRVRLTAGPASVLIEVDANGDGIYEESNTVDWATLEAA